MTDLGKEIEIRTSRSGGKGGQNVNKVETRVEARFDIERSRVLSDEEKALLLLKLSDKINSEGILQVFCSEKRTQLENKQIAIRKLYHIIAQGLKTELPRKKTRVPKAVKEKRFDTKKKHSELKSLRRKIF